MKTMNRNKSTLYYALYKNKTPKTDEYGNLTGEYEIVRDNPIEFSANVSAAKGKTSTSVFGENENYDKVIVIDNASCPPVDEYTVLWIDSVPELDSKGVLKVDEYGDVVTPYDYVVKNVAKSLNSVSIAISKVKVDG